MCGIVGGRLQLLPVAVRVDGLGSRLFRTDHCPEDARRPSSEGQAYGVAEP